MTRPMPLFWKEFLILLAATVLSIIAIMPYALTLQAGLLKQIVLPMPLWELLALQMVENTLLFAVMIAAGLYLGRKVGLGMPILEGALEGKDVSRQLGRVTVLSVMVGVLAALLLVAMDLFFAHAGIRIGSQGAAPPAWQGFLAAFYGGIAEEVSMRLFLMTLLVWLLREVKRALKGKPSGLEIWLAILLSAVLFGLGHLPMTRVLTDLTPMVVARAVALNGVFGVVMGWLYWKQGLESAMIAHFSGDLVLHVILPII